MIKGIIFDYNRTVYDPETGQLTVGVIELLEKLTEDGYKLCLLSKKKFGDRRGQISKLGLDKYFLDIQVIEGDKTEQNFIQCLEKMSLQPEEILVVGDRVKGEIFLGNKFGMKTIWYKSGKFASELPESPGEKPNHTIVRLTEIINFLK